MNKKTILLTLILILFAYPVHGFLGSLFKPAKESDMISYYAPCWGEDNKIYFIKCVTFGVAIHEKDAIGRGLLLGGDYFVKDVKYFLCSMNYDGTDKKEITELFTKKVRKEYKRKFGKKLENYGVKGTYMDYSPITKKLVYDIGGIWTINIDGTEEQCIMGNGWSLDGKVYHYHPSWSPDGKKIVYRVQIKEGRRENGFLVGDIKYYDSLWVMDADGRNKQKIFSGEVDEWVEFPIWSPKGDLIAFGHNFWIWVMKPDGTERRRVYKGGLGNWWIDGKMLLVEGAVVIDLNGNIVKEMNWSGSLSPDGKFGVGGGFRVIRIGTGELVKDLFPVDIKDRNKHFVYKKPNNIW